MPYFLYKIMPEKRFELIERFDVYREARDEARARRSQMSAEDQYTIKVMFAKDQEQAERLMSEEREARPLGEDA